MTSRIEPSWRCGVCGYIHRGAEPPEVCPVCGAARSEFERVEEAAPATRTSPVVAWRCMNCTYVHSGAEPPAICPVCAATRDSFEPLGESGETAPPSGQPGRVIVVGAGIAGLSAAEAVRQSAPRTEITVVSKEEELPYYRLNLTRYLAGEIGPGDLPIYPGAWYEERGIRLLRGQEVATVGLEDRDVTLRTGDRLAFDKLILTIGAHPFVPPIPGSSREGVTGLRTLQDAEFVLGSIRDACESVCCIGGGLLGLETAGALARRGCRVTLLEGHGWLLPRQLNRDAGEILLRHVESMGVDVRLACRIEEVAGDERVRGLGLADGTNLPVDLAVITTGIRPNSYLARQAGLHVNQGVVVDGRLCTSHPDVLAAGDLAEHQGTLYGVWGPSMFQGRIAGMNAAGLRAEFGGIPRSNTLKVLGLDLFSIGRVEPEDASYGVLDQQEEGKYFRMVFRDSYLVGAILLGEGHHNATVKRAVEERIDFSGLLRRKPRVTDVLDHLAGAGSP